MIEIKNKTDCCGCHACYNICPKNAIEMKKDEKGFKYPAIDSEKCINCGLCNKVCPIINNKIIENKPQAYACYCKNETIRQNSSSGGIFTIIAINILKDNGVIFGASFDENFDVKHVKIDNIEGLEKLRGSKYVQSDINNTYKQAKEYLENNRIVLFTGTPCQIEGLKRYLQKDFDNLYTQDIICHGVPSPKAWNTYKNYRKEKDKKEPKNISFRNKNKGWSKYSVLFRYNKGEYLKRQSEDLYMKVFLQNLSLRDSCYDCKFKKYNRISDITLADFWGIDNIMPKMNDNKGTSLVVINSEKGKELFESIKNEMIYKETNLDEAIKYNPSMIKSVDMNTKRDKFFEDLDNKEFDKLAKKYLIRQSLVRRGIEKVKRIIEM